MCCDDPFTTKFVCTSDAAQRACPHVRHARMCGIPSSVLNPSKRLPSSRGDPTDWPHLAERRCALFARHPPRCRSRTRACADLPPHCCWPSCWPAAARWSDSGFVVPPGSAMRADGTGSSGHRGCQRWDGMAARLRFPEIASVAAAWCCPRAVAMSSGLLPGLRPMQPRTRTVRGLRPCLRPAVPARRRRPHQLAPCIGAGRIGLVLPWLCTARAWLGRGGEGEASKPWPLPPHLPAPARDWKHGG